MDTRKRFADAPSLDQKIKTLQRQVTALRDERRALVAHSGVALLFLRSNEIVEANEAAAALTAYPVERLVGMSVRALLPRDALPERAGPDDEAPGDGLEKTPVFLKRGDGGSVAVRLVCCRVRREGALAALVFLHPVAQDARPHCREDEPAAAAPGERREVSCEFPSIIGKSAQVRKICMLIGKVAKTDSTVLIQGESGTGKEVFARTIHYHSRRVKGPLVCVNCAALSETLLESELFGHVKGAFTGAVSSRKGRFGQAHRGTLLLDEIGSMSLSGQTKLLRVLQEREYEPVGSSVTQSVDVRVIATTNVDLRAAVEAGAFRQDLFYRLGVISFRLPPLRERREDIPLLAQAFLRRYTRLMHKDIAGFYPEALKLLLGHTWPGNVRELENVVERAVVVEEQAMVQPSSIAIQARTEEEDAGGCCDKPLGLREQLEILEKQIVLQTLGKVDWVRKRAALELGIDPRNFNYFLRKHNITENDRVWHGGP